MAALPPDHLSDREKQVVILITSGLSSREIALKLGIALKTVASHRYNAMSPLGGENGAPAARGIEPFSSALKALPNTLRKSYENVHRNLKFY